LADYDGQDVAGALINISEELPKLLDRRARAVAVFTERGISDLKEEVTACVELLEDLRIRADFINKVRLFYESLDILEHRPEVPNDVFRDAKLLGFINKVAANLYRDPALNLLGVAEKVKALIDGHVTARGIDPKIPPIAITDANFEELVSRHVSARNRAAEMQHAARYHIISFSAQNPAYARKMSEKLEEILRKFKDDWDALERELRKFIQELRKGPTPIPGAPNITVPFISLIADQLGGWDSISNSQKSKVVQVTVEIVDRIQQEVRKVGFWRNLYAREVLTKALVRDLDASRLCPAGKERDLAQQLVALAKENHENLTR
jgi:type I restriction enzyme R subunit